MAQCNFDKETKCATGFGIILFMMGLRAPCHVYAEIPVSMHRIYMFIFIHIHVNILPVGLLMN